MNASHAARARVGTVVDGRWRLDALVAVGGCAAIYAATHRVNGHRAAVKVFDVELADNPTAVAHFLSEGRAANRIEHPGVVAVIDEGTTDDGAPYLLMPLLDGETAQQRLARSPSGLPVDEALGIVEAVLDVLVAAHGRGIVHRDLKPDNVFLERGGGVRVLDFGIARLADHPDRTAYGTVLGTPGYMAPEQACGRLDEVGPRSDLWSAGALLYTLLTGRVLHEASSPIASVLRAQREPVGAASELVPGAPEAVAHVLDGALAFDPAQRWMDATAMRWAVRAAVDRRRREGVSCAGVAVDALGARSASDAPVGMDPPPPPRITWKPVPWIAAVGMAVLLALAGAVTRGHRPEGGSAAAANGPAAASGPIAQPAAATPPAASAPAPSTPAVPTVSVDTLPRVVAATAPRAPSKARGRAAEIVRKVDF